MKKDSILIYFGILITIFIISPTFAINKNVKVENTETDEFEKNDKIPVSTGRYITGGVLGSAIGLGLGHAVHGRYLDNGYLFTLGELFLPFVIGPAIYKMRTTKTQREKCTDFCGFTDGFYIFVGLRVWETIDLWVGAKPVSNDGLKPVLYFENKEPKLGFVLNF